MNNMISLGLWMHRLIWEQVHITRLQLEGISKVKVKVMVKARVKFSSLLIPVHIKYRPTNRHVTVPGVGGGEVAGVGGGRGGVDGGRMLHQYLDLPGLRPHPMQPHMEG